MQNGVFIFHDERERLHVAVVYNLFIKEKDIHNITHLESWYSELVAHLAIVVALASYHVVASIDIDNLSIRLYDPNTKNFHLTLLLSKNGVALLESRVVELRELLDGGIIVELDEHACELMSPQFLCSTKAHESSHLNIGLASKFHIGARS